MTREKLIKQIEIIKKEKRKALTSKEAAKKSLQNAGIITKSGNLSPKYKD